MGEQADIGVSLAHAGRVDDEFETENNGAQHQSGFEKVEEKELQNITDGARNYYI